MSGYTDLAIEQFYTARRVRGLYSDDCMRASWYYLLCAAVAADKAPRVPSGVLASDSKPNERNPL